MSIRDIEVTADSLEEVLQGLVDGIDDLGAVERSLGLDVRGMIGLMRQFEHSSDEYHNGEDVLEHTRWVMADLEDLIGDMADERKVVLRLAALLHDIGKAYTFEVQPDGKHTFRKHAEKSVELAEALLARHRAELGDLHDQVVELVRRHDEFMRLLEARRGAKDLKYLNKFMQGPIYLGGHLDDLLTLAKADGNRSKVRDQTLADIEGVLADLAQVERERAEAAKAKARFDENARRMLPEVRDLLRQEGMTEAAGASTLSEINAILGKVKRYDLIKRIQAMLERG